MKNPVIGSAPCDQTGCNEITTVHEVKRGGSLRKGQLYTRCPNCKANQTTGDVRQQWIIDNTTPRPEYAELFDFKKQSSDSAVSEDKNIDDDVIEEPSNTDDSEVSPDSDKPSSAGLVVGLLGMVVVSGLAFLGLKK